MAEKKIIIVGAGIAGLSAGLYARMNGYKTSIFEMHDIPGGLCAAWTRKGYTFDISMHMLMGSKSGPFHTMWQELGAIQGRQFAYHKESSRIESRDKTLIIGTDRQQLEQQMLALSPPDAKLTKEFISLFYGKGVMGAASLKPQELAGPLDGLKAMLAILPLMRKFRKYGRTTVQEFAQRFQDPFLRNVIRFVIDGPGWPMVNFPLIGLAGFLNSSLTEAGVPIGGSKQVVFQIAERYKKLGGAINYKSRVKDLIIENNRAVGIKLEDGAEHRADIIIWAGDGKTVIFDILKIRYLDDKIKQMYEHWIPVLPMIHVMLGVARDMSKEPARLNYELEKPIMIAGEERKWLSVIHHSFDPTAAPPGKSAMEVWYPTRYDYWEKLYKQQDQYEAEKKRIAEITIAELNKRWPGLAAQIELVDVPTPMTYVRYTGNWQGSPDGWYVTSDNMRRNPLRALPGLSGFYMVGQWTAPFTGTVIAALSGRQIVQLLCKGDGKKFVTTAH
jgi:phytoene dehydrogenase-like protein